MTIINSTVEASGPYSGEHGVVALRGITLNWEQNDTIVRTGTHDVFGSYYYLDGEDGNTKDILLTTVPSDPEPTPEPDPSPAPTPAPEPAPTPAPKPAPSAPARTVLPKTADATLIVEAAISASGALALMASVLHGRRREA